MSSTKYIFPLDHYVTKAGKRENSNKRKFRNDFVFFNLHPSCFCGSRIPRYSGGECKRAEFSSFVGGLFEPRTLTKVSQVTMNEMELYRPRINLPRIWSMIVLHATKCVNCMLVWNSQHWADGVSSLKSGCCYPKKVIYCEDRMHMSRSNGIWWLADMSKPHIEVTMSLDWESLNLVDTLLVRCISPWNCSSLENFPHGMEHLKGVAVWIIVLLDDMKVILKYKYSSLSRHNDSIYSISKCKL